MKFCKPFDRQFTYFPVIGHPSVKFIFDIAYLSIYYSVQSIFFQIPEILYPEAVSFIEVFPGVDDLPYEVSCPVYSFRDLNVRCPEMISDYQFMSATFSQNHGSRIIFWYPSH